MRMPNGLIPSMRICTAFVVFAAMAAAASVAGAAPSAKDLVKAELLADTSAIKPGESFLVGVMLKMKPGWHVYWKNPGDSGLPTSVQWKLPEGFGFSELMFPIPKRFDQPGDVVGYGYADQVLFITEITTPKDFPRGTGVEVQADVSFLVCEDVCLPGKETLRLTLPVKDAKSPANESVFTEWKSRLPAPASHSDAVKAAGLSKTSIREAFIAWQKSPGDVQWFPAPPANSGLEKIQTDTQQNVSKMSFALVPEIDKEAPMSFLVAYSDESGKQCGVEFTVNLPPQKK